MAIVCRKIYFQNKKNLKFFNGHCPLKIFFPIGKKFSLFSDDISGWKNFPMEDIHSKSSVGISLFSCSEKSNF